MTAWNAASAPDLLAFSNGNLTAAKVSGTSYRWTRSLTGHNAGRKYFQARLDAATNSSECAVLGLATASASLTSYLGNSLQGIGYYCSGDLWFSGSSIGIIAAVSASEWARCAVDFDAGAAWFGDQSGWDGDPAAGTDPTWTFTPGTTLYAGFTLYLAGDQITVNFGGSPFNNAAPAGFDAWSPSIGGGNRAARASMLNRMRRAA
jgi:hypothetical protein